MASGSTISIGGAISYPPPPSQPVGYHRLRGPRKPGRIHVRSHSHSPLDCYPSSRFILLPINPAAQLISPIDLGVPEDWQDNEKEGAEQQDPNHIRPGERPPAVYLDQSDHCRHRTYRGDDEQPEPE